MHETGSVEAADARGGGADAKGPGGDPGMGMMRADRTLPDLSLAVRQLGTLFSADGMTFAPQATDAARHPTTIRTSSPRSTSSRANGMSMRWPR